MTSRFFRRLMIGRFGAGGGRGAAGRAGVRRLLRGFRCSADARHEFRHFYHAGRDRRGAEQFWRDDVLFCETGPTAQYGIDALTS